jgi:hypothetical protein
MGSYFMTTSARSGINLIGNCVLSVKQLVGKPRFADNPHDPMVVG